MICAAHLIIIQLQFDQRCQRIQVLYLLDEIVPETQHANVLKNFKALDFGDSTVIEVNFFRTGIDHDLFDYFIISSCLIRATSRAN